MNLELIISKENDPWFNLALEEYLLQNIREETVIMYLWQNANTVVVGKSQNSWKECRVSILESEGGKLARRSSGGGAVYHDMGNLCYTFLASNSLYSVERQLETVLTAVSYLGIEGKFTGRNDITAIDGRKFSGNAFQHGKQASLMHGTLLIDTDPVKISRYLQVSEAKLKSKGVDSVRSRVVNLTQLNPDITALKAMEAMKKAFAQIYSFEGDPVYYRLDDIEKFRDIYEKYSSWDWRLGQNYSFDLETQHRFNWGSLEIMFNSDKGHVTGAKAFTDANDPGIADVITSILPGLPLDYHIIYAALDSAFCAAGTDPVIAGEILDWIKTIL